MNDIRTTAMLLESKKGIQQAQGVARLTMLPFFFIPLSFTTSFFGMNFAELGTGKYSIWLWFAVSVPIFAVALVFVFLGRFVEAFGEEEEVEEAQTSSRSFNAERTRYELIVSYVRMDVLWLCYIPLLRDTNCKHTATCRFSRPNDLQCM